MTPHKSYIIFVLGITALFMLPPMMVNDFILKKSGEYLSSSEIFAKQSQQNSFNVYGSAISDKAIELKLHAYEEIKPEIAVIGSSRTLQFRQKFFKKPFYNMGLTVSSVDELRDMTDKMTVLHKPQIMIIGADFWWFHPDKEKDQQEIRKEEAKRKKKEKKILSVIKISEPVQLYNAAEKRIQNLTLPVQWLYEGSIKPDDYTKLLLSSSINHIGVRGKLRHDGIAPDGSYYYTDRVTGRHIGKKEQFNETIERIEKEEYQFISGSKSSPKLIEEVQTIIKSLNKKGIEVIIFFPPVAPKILSELNQRDYKYIDEIGEIFLAKKIVHFNFIDPAKIGPATDCEFIDGFHGGDVLYARIIYKMSQGNKALAKAIDMKYLENAEINKGMAMIPEPRLTSRKEVDFLEMGCQK